MFLPLTLEHVKLIAVKQMELWRKRACDRHGIDLHWEQEVIEHVCRDGRAYNERYGARSLKNEVERAVIGKLAQAY